MSAQSDGDTVIVFFDANAMARDGKPYVNTYAWFLQMRDRRVVAASAFFDSLDFNELWTRLTPASSQQEGCTFSDDIFRVPVIAQRNKLRMPKMVVRRPFDKLKLTDQ